MYINKHIYIIILFILITCIYMITGIKEYLENGFRCILRIIALLCLQNPLFQKACHLDHINNMNKAPSTNHSLLVQLCTLSSKYYKDKRFVIIITVSIVLIVFIMIVSFMINKQYIYTILIYIIYLYMYLHILYRFKHHLCSCLIAMSTECYKTNLPIIIKYQRLSYINKYITYINILLKKYNIYKENINNDTLSLNNNTDIDYTKECEWLLVVQLSQTIPIELWYIISNSFLL